MNRHFQRLWIWAGALCAWGGCAATAQNPECTELQNGYVSWTNANTNLYYTLEHSSALTNGSAWDGAGRAWQDLRSPAGVFTVPIGRFYRVVASSNPLHTARLSSTSAVVSAGYYEATNLAGADSDLATANIRAGVAIFGVTGSPMVVNTSSGNATTNDLLAGRVAWVDGAAVTGAIPTRALAATTVVVNAGYYLATNLAAVDADLAVTNLRGGITLFGVTGSPMVVNTASGTATTNDLLAGYVAWVDGAAVTGAVPTRTLSDTTTVMKAGYYAADALNAVDPDLVATNLRAGTILFGVTGTIPPAPVPKTGCTISRETGDDGHYQKGVAWPVPRFTTGTSTSSNCVTDNLTGLTWLRNPTATLRNCSDSILYCENLTGTSGRGGFTDWRLPNMREMQSLFDYYNRAPALPTGHPFIGVPATNDFWTGTLAYNGGGAILFFFASMDRGTTAVLAPSNTLCAWPVRGGF